MKKLSLLSETKVGLSFARREMRAGLRGFFVLIACLTLGVAAISGVNGLSASLVDTIAKEGQTILGGDIRFSLVHREADETEFNHLKAQGTLGTSATMRTMARLPDNENFKNQTLVELKGVDTLYPLYGSLELLSKKALHPYLKKISENLYGGVAEEELLIRLNLELGDIINLGAINIKINDVITKEPDRLSGAIEFGPRLMVSLEALKASKLVQPGSLVRWHYKIKLNDKSPAFVREETEKALPNAGWRIRARDNASPGLSNNIQRFADFLTLVGLTALLIGGLGVANATKNYMDKKRRDIAVLKSIGASSRFVFIVYLLQVLILSTLAILVGLLIGAFIPAIANSFLKDFLPVALNATPKPETFLFAALYGYLISLSFALWPLAKARSTKPASLFRGLEDSQKWPPILFLIILAGLLTILSALVIVLAKNPLIAGYFILGSLFSFISLKLVSNLIMAFCKALPSLPSPQWRLAISNIYRPFAITPSIILSLGLGLTLLVTIALIDGNLRNRLTSSIAEEAPSFFFVDIQNHQLDTFKKAINDKAPNGTLEQVPMLRGFFVEIAGKKPEEMTVPSESQWALRGDRGITYSAKLPKNSTLDEGEWWPENYSGPPLVSFDEEIARHFGLKIGDKVKVNVLGRTIEAELANTRKLEWQSLAINFVMVFSPNTFQGAPHTHLATLRFDEQKNVTEELKLLSSISTLFPTITSVRVKEALEQVSNVVGQLSLAIRLAASVTLLSVILVLVGTLAANHQSQVKEAVVLKTLGASRFQLLSAYLIQYGLLGTITALFGLLTGTAAAWFVIENIMQGDFIFLPFEALLITLVALLTCILLGLIGTARILSQKAAPYLRNL